MADSSPAAECSESGVPHSSAHLRERDEHLSNSAYGPRACRGRRVGLGIPSRTVLMAILFAVCATAHKLPQGGTADMELDDEARCLLKHAQRPSTFSWPQNRFSCINSIARLT